jgi:hypothetical protein
MSGRRHHYLPRFLQRGFLASASGERTWLFRKGHPERLVGITGIGVEKDFYGSTAAVDLIITSAEGEEFAPLINLARGAANETELDAAVCARLFSHLEVRSNNLREGFLKASEFLWAKTIERFQTPGVLDEIVRKRFARNPNLLLDAARQGLLERGQPEHLAPLIAQLGTALLKKPDFVAQQISMILPILKAILPAKLQLAAKQGHLNALERDVAPEPRTQQYQKLKFDVRYAANQSFVLGDSAAVFHLEDAQRSFKPFVDKDDKVLAAILPISSNRLLVGSTDSYSLDTELVRERAATCAIEFFVASTNAASNNQLAEKIGLDAPPLTTAELDGIIAQVIEEEMQ